MKKKTIKKEILWKNCRFCGGVMKRTVVDIGFFDPQTGLNKLEVFWRCENFHSWFRGIVHDDEQIENEDRWKPLKVPPITY